MLKLTVDTIREAANNADALMESSAPEVKLLLENPSFAVGLCIKLHKEVSELRKRLEQLEQGAQGNEDEGRPFGYQDDDDRNERRRIEPPRRNDDRRESRAFGEPHEQEQEEIHTTPEAEIYAQQAQTNWQEAPRRDRPMRPRAPKNQQPQARQTGQRSRTPSGREETSGSDLYV